MSFLKSKTVCSVGTAVVVIGALAAIYIVSMTPLLPLLQCVMD